jgi:hypothetical protein
MRAYLLVVSLATVSQAGYCQAQSLFEALRQGELTKVRAAINDGADVNSRDEGGNTLLMQAAVFAMAADLEFLLAHGADVNAANKGGHTALMRAMPDQKFATTATPGMEARAYHTATMLINGRILIAGGITADGQPTSKLVLWDPRTKTARNLAAWLATHPCKRR